jgi:hypothetical protein
MEPRVFLPLALFLVLLALFVLVLRRASLLLATTREHDRFQRAVRDLDARVASTLDPIIDHLDELRRHRSDPAKLAEQLSSAASTLRRQAEEARALRPPSGLGDVPSAYARELERAERAIGLAEHGRSGLVANRGGPRELEAQTALKRAALNLRHAREAAETLARRVERAVPPGVARARERQRAAAAAQASHAAAAQGAQATGTPGVPARIVAPPPAPPAPPALRDEPSTPVSSGILPTDHKQ